MNTKSKIQNETNSQRCIGINICQDGVNTKSKIQNETNSQRNTITKIYCQMTKLCL